VGSCADLESPRSGSFKARDTEGLGEPYDAKASTKALFWTGFVFEDELAQRGGRGSDQCGIFADARHSPTGLAAVTGRHVIRHGGVLAIAAVALMGGKALRRALDEGFNVPETEVGIIATSTATPRQRIQRLGRVLRPTEGKNGATVYTLVATEPEIQRLR
jgi:hypothetical protein